MIKIAIKCSFFGVLLAFATPLYAQNQSLDRQSSSEKSIEEAYYNGDPLALGIVLSFKNRWPNKEEEKLIMETAQKEGLRKTYATGSSLRWWVFSWPDVQLRETALSTCSRFSQDMHYLLDFCADNPLPRVH